MAMLGAVLTVFEQTPFTRAARNVRTLYRETLNARQDIPGGISLGVTFQVYAPVISIRPRTNQAATEQNARDKIG
jgi:hypothetical protein